MAKSAVESWRRAASEALASPAKGGAAVQPEKLQEVLVTSTGLWLLMVLTEQNISSL
jgi:hypothetical protein